MSAPSRLGQPGTCPSFTHPDCHAPLVFAHTILPTRWGTGQVVYGEGSCPGDRDNPCFTATSIAECAAGHRVAGGRKARVFQP